MRHWYLAAVVGTAVLTLGQLAAPEVQACSLCDGRLTASPTFRQEGTQPTARMILYGTISNPRLVAGAGTCDLSIRTVLKTDAWLGARKVIELPRYLAVSDPKEPPRFLIFCDLAGGKLDPYRGIPLKQDSSVAYIKQALALTDKDVPGNLAFFFRHLDDPDPEVARDAFLEFARANDRDVALAAPRLSREKVRTWLQDPATPQDRLGLYAMILGATGKPEDAALLRGLLETGGERYTNAADGLLAGLLALEPRPTWQYLSRVVADPKQPLTLRLGALRTLRFAFGADPKGNRAGILTALAAALGEKEIADLAVEDLRRWELWDLTPQVLALYGRKGYDAPLMQRAILRYALSARGTAEAGPFLARARAADPEVVKEVEESLRLERTLPR